MKFIIFTHQKTTLENEYTKYMDQKKIFILYLSDRSPVTRIYKDLIHLNNNKKIDTSIF